MAWLTAKCPVSVQAERWIQDSLRWLLAEFGGDALNGEVLLPESVFPPGSFSGTEAGLRPLLQRLCTRVGVDIDAIQVDLSDDPDIPTTRTWCPARASSSPANRPAALPPAMTTSNACPAWRAPPFRTDSAPG